MIRINQLKVKLQYNNEELIRCIARRLHIKEKDIKSFNIIRRSLDARDKDNITYIFSVDIETDLEKRLLFTFRKDKNISLSVSNKYVLPPIKEINSTNRPVIIGAGPAGLFCSLYLAAYGFKPILIEQGDAVEERVKKVESFIGDHSQLDIYSNVQFGEGGAGAFSDGKLNSTVKDTNGRKSEILRIFAENGAPKEILYNAEPHIGTDILVDVVKNIRNKIIEYGGEVLFNTKFIDFYEEHGKILSIDLLNKTKGRFTVPCDCLVLAIGHSSRDTYRMLYSKGINMAAKPFAVGVRAEHLQEDINRAQYGANYKEKYGNCLSAASYKLTAHTKNNRAVYSFCMCPGGYVINSSSEKGKLCVNGMSYSARDGKNANSAIVVNVTPFDTDSHLNVLNGLKFQENIEKRAYDIGMGSMPVQRLEDFIEKKAGTQYGKVLPQSKGSVRMSDLNDIFPGFICESIKEAFSYFGKKIKGFDDPDTLLTAVESRTSSPIRIIRDSSMQSSIEGIYPCGEGAGYAGGITSSAIDGIKIFEEIYQKYT